MTELVIQDVSGSSYAVPEISHFIKEYWFHLRENGI